MAFAPKLEAFQQPPQEHPMRIPPSSFSVLSAHRSQSHHLPKPEKSLAQNEQKTAPPGLERALARLQSLPEPTAGQTNATDRISRNLARYADTQAIGTPVPPANATT